jgi:ABC-2 type transport system permease protein
MKYLATSKNVNQIRVMLALTKAAVIASLRNPTTIFFNFFFPFVFIGIFGMLDNDNIKIDLAIRAGSVKSGPAYEALKKVDTLVILDNLSDDQINDKLNKGRLSAALNIVEEDTIVTPGQPAIKTYKLTLEKSAASPQTASVISSIVDKVGTSINSVAQGDKAFKMVTLTETVVAGRKFSQIDFILPGQLAFALLMNALFGMSFGLITLKKELVLKRIFASPAKKWTIMAAQVLSKGFLAIMQTLVIVIVGHYLFNFTLVDGAVTVVNILILGLIGIFTFLAMGLFVAVVSKNEDMATPISQLIMMPQLFLAGAFFALEAFPGFIQVIARVLPMTLLNDAIKKVAFEGASLAMVGNEILGIIIWGVVLYLVIVRLFKWE